MGFFDWDDSKKKPEAVAPTKKKKYERIDAKKASRMSVSQILSEIKKGKTVSGYEAWCEENIGAVRVKNVNKGMLEKRKKELGGTDFEGTTKTNRRSSLATTFGELKAQNRRNVPGGAFGTGPRNEDGSPRKSWW